MAGLTLFRRLIYAYLLVLAATIPIAGIIGFSTSDAIFEAKFDDLLSSHFGRVAEKSGATLVLFGLVLILHIASLIGLRKLRRWSRPLFVLTNGAIIAFDTASSLPIYYSWAFVIPFDEAAAMLTGAILLLAYLPSYGQDWFVNNARPAG